MLFHQYIEFVVVVVHTDLVAAMRKLVVPLTVPFVAVELHIIEMVEVAVMELAAVLEAEVVDHIHWFELLAMALGQEPVLQVYFLVM